MKSMLSQCPRTGAVRFALVIATAASFSARAEIDSTFLGSQDAKFYSGAVCNANRHADLLITKNGQAYNTSTSFALDITCPLERDMTNTTTMQVTLWLVKNSTDEMRCVFNARKMDNTAFLGGGAATVTITNNGTTMVTLGPLAVAAQGSFNVSCNVPKASSGRSGIVGIETLETN